MSLINPFSFLRDSTHPSHKFKNPIQIGLILPLITSIITFGNLVWLTSTTFDVKPKSYRAAKRFGLYSFSEVTENHIGLIAFWGILFNLILAVIAYILNFPEFARLSIYYAAFNLLPLSELDGNKLFFGNMVLWCITTIVTLIALAYAILLI
jgi:Zn-dependent protease